MLHFPPNLASTCTKKYYTVRVHSYAHSLHIKVLKHFVCIQYRCGMQSGAVFSVHHDSTASLGLTAHTCPHFPWNWHPPTQVLQCKGTPICSSAAYQGAKTLCLIQYRCEMQSAGVCSLNHDTTASSGLAHAPYYQNLTRTTCTSVAVVRCKSTPICPSTAHQGAFKTLCIHPIW
jgi:hypothetical protein